MTGTMPRYGAKRDASEKLIVEAFEACGCDVYRLDRPVDLLVYHPAFKSRVMLVECKTGKESLNDWQKRFVERWPVHVVRTAAEAVALMNKTRRAA